ILIPSVKAPLPGANLTKSESKLMCQTLWRIRSSKRFYGSRRTKFPKICKKRKNCEAHQRHARKSEVRILREAQRYSGCRVRASPLRSHHNTRKNGISESVKKRGPPRRWIRL